MLAYVIRRLLLVIPTLIGIMVINFAVIQFAPGGPVEIMIARIKGNAVEATARFAGGGGELTGQDRQGQSGDRGGGSSKYRGAQGISPEVIQKLERQFGFDKPVHVRFLEMMARYAVFDFGESAFSSRRVIDLVIDKMPVSISLGLWATIITYFVCIPLGVAKARRDGSRFDAWSSTVILALYSIPSFLLAILFIVLFAGGSFPELKLFPLRGLTSDNWPLLSWPDRIVDYFWHMTLPVICLVTGSFAGLTMLTKNSFLEELNKQYVMTARAKGLSQQRVLYGHVFRNAMLIVIAGFPGLFMGILFSGALLIETIFSLDGLGLLGFEAAINRDYPVMFASLYFFTLIGLVMVIVRDITYMFVDPRIDFDRRGA